MFRCRASLYGYLQPNARPPQLVTTYHEEVPSPFSLQTANSAFFYFSKKNKKRFSPVSNDIVLRFENKRVVPASPQRSGKAVSICDAVAPTHKKQNCPPFPPLKKILSEVTAQMRVFTYSEPEGSLQQHTHANPLLRTNNPTDPTILSLSAQPSIICKKQPQGPKMWVVPSLLVSNIYALALIYFGEFSSPLCHRVARIYPKHTHPPTHPTTMHTHPP